MKSTNVMDDVIEYQNLIVLDNVIEYQNFIEDAKNPFLEPLS